MEKRKILPLPGIETLPSISYPVATPTAASETSDPNSTLTRLMAGKYYNAYTVTMKASNHYM
jgi:hypothetical protein